MFWLYCFETQVHKITVYRWVKFCFNVLISTPDNEVSVLIFYDNLSLVVRKPVFRVSDQV